MNNFEIDYILKHHPVTRKIYGGTYSRDTLPETIGQKRLFICNTDIAKGPGIHWVALYFYKNRNIMQADYFDPLGFPPILPIIKFLKKHVVSWTWNNKRIQSLSSKACGFHVLYFAILRSQGRSMLSIIHYFSKNYKKNDYLVTAFISSLLYKVGYFGKNFKYVLSHPSI